MFKPNDFDTAPEYGEQKPLEPGGHILKILKVEETTSRNGAEMIIIYFDTDASDKQPRYYKQRYDSDNRKDKPWLGRVWQLTHDRDGNTNPAFKTFVTSFQKSNGITVAWGDKFCECFRDKLIGGIFRREQYVVSEGKNAGKLAWSVKCFSFRSVETIKNGVDIPEDKLLPENARAGGYPVPQYMDTNVSAADDDYPF